MRILQVVARSAASARSRERIRRVCETPADAKTLRLQLLEELARTVAFDAYAWLMTDPETSVGIAPLADVPSLQELPRLIRLKYLTGVNRWTALSAPPVASLYQATAGQLEQSLQWRELLHRFDVRDVASSVFRDRFGCWGFLELWRSGASMPFTADEIGFLEDIAEPVTRAMRGAQANTFVEGPARQARGTGPAVLLLSGDLDLRGQTPETDEFLNMLLPQLPDRAPIPAGAYNVAAQLLAVEAGVDGNPPSARVHLAGGRWVTLRAARIGTSTPGPGGDIAVTIEETTPDERLELFIRAFALSPRESELLRLLATGADTRTISQSMYLSEHTVQDHLKSIFAKTSAANRRTLLARAAGT
jgi:DNA-binding CsgD family transcriptional regulator